MREQSESICFQAEDGTKVFFSVIEETMLAGEKYLLVSEETEEEAYILRKAKEEGEEAVYEIVEEPAKLEVLSKVFSELLGDIDLLFTV